MSILTDKRGVAAGGKSRQTNVIVPTPKAEMPSMQIRPERAGDEAAIRDVTAAAFRTMPYSQQTEAAIVDALRAADALTVSLVAVDHQHVVGHVAFSPITIDEKEGLGWYGVGPLSVHPDFQGQGIGSALMHAGLREIAALGGNGCVLVGEPAFYGRFGFVMSEGLSYPGVPKQYFQILTFSGASPTGIAGYHAGFNATDNN